MVPTHSSSLQALLTHIFCLFFAFSLVSTGLVIVKKVEVESCPENADSIVSLECFVK